VARCRSSPLLISCYAHSEYLLGIDTSLEDAARDLGADTIKIYRDVVLPLIADCVVEAILAFVLSWTNYYIASCMSGSNILIMTCIHGRLTQRFSSLVPAVASDSMLCFAGGADCGDCRRVLRRLNAVSTTTTC
jgi:ABC-type spermidine/putrescine transport system permease subunit II